MVKEFNAPFHPLRTDVFLEAAICIKNKRGDATEIQNHINKYKGIIPRRNGLITSGILIRKNTPAVKTLSEAWWKELSENSTRDQISFAKVSIGNDHLIYKYKWDYRRGHNNNEFIFKTHFHRR
jgi:hypothetical protein